MTITSIANACLVAAIAGTLPGSMPWHFAAAPEPPAKGETAVGQPSAPVPPPQQTVAPRALNPLRADYPQAGRGQARVLVQLLVSAQGEVSEATVVQGQEPFSASARQAALTWRFEPAQHNGQATAARIRVEVLFEPPSLPEQAIEPPSPPSESAPNRAPLPGSKPPPVQPPVDASAAPAPFNVEVRGVRPVGLTQLGRAEVRQMPGAFGDPYRAIESLPGVTPIASGLPYFFIRGAPPGNVGYFFDRTEVPLLYHAAAGPGVIHPAFVESVDLFAGAYPARYGRYAGGIVTGQAQRPLGEARGELNVRLVDAGAFVETPFANGRGNAMLAGRYSYTGAVISLLAPDVSLGYWDYQARLQYDLTRDDTVSVFGFGSYDFLAADNSRGQRRNILDLTFHRLNVSHRRELNANRSLTTTAFVGLDRTALGGDPEETQARQPAQLLTRTAGARVLYEAQLGAALALRVGGDAQRSNVEIEIDLGNEPRRPAAPPGPDTGGPSTPSSPPGSAPPVVPPLPQPEDPTRSLQDVTFPVPGFPDLVLEPLELFEEQSDQQTLDARFPSRLQYVAGTFAEAVITAGGGITVTPGFRVDIYHSNSELSIAPEPRLTVRYDIHPKLSLTHAIGLAHQPPSFAIPLPGLGGAARDGLQRAIQSSAGLELQLPAELFASATFFQNTTFNSTDVFGVSNLQDADPTVDSFASKTSNHSYGMELYLRRALTARLGGFASYTLSRSTRSVARLSGPSSFDRRHVLNVALAFDLGSRVRLGTRAVAYSGIPAEVAYAEAAARPPRTPWYYRLDFRLEKRWLVGTDGAWWSLVAEALNTTLNEEVLRSSCYAYGCQREPIGPVTIPSLGIEASF